MLDVVERCVENLDDVNRIIIMTRYFNKADMYFVAAKVFMTRQAVYKRIKKVCEKIDFILANTPF